MYSYYERYNQVSQLVEAAEYLQAIQESLDFLQTLAKDYIRLEIYNHQQYDGDDFYSHDVEKLLASVLRSAQTPVESVHYARQKLAEIKQMEAYQEYYLCTFEHVHEAIQYRLADAETYLAELDKQLSRHAHEYQYQMKQSNWEQSLTLYGFEELGKLLVKKIEYLKSHDRADAVAAVFKEYPYVPALHTYKINQLIEQGYDEEALAAIEEAIRPYGDDGYNSTREWHLQKITLLEKRNDRQGIIEEYRRLFRQFLNEKRPFYEKLKSLVPAEEWDGFVVKLFEDIPHVTEDESIEICDLIVEEGKYGCLLKILMANADSFCRVELFQRYASYMTPEDQTAFTLAVIDNLRFRLSYAKSKSYGYIVDDIKGMFYSCETSQNLMISFIEEIIANYGNRPALMRLLGV